LKPFPRLRARKPERWHGVKSASRNVGEVPAPRAIARDWVARHDPRVLKNNGLPEQPFQKQRAA
jgi:hypothetical protein